MNTFALMLVLIAQATQPVDVTMEWLLEQPLPVVVPSTQAASQPATPFNEKPAPGERVGALVLSDGKIHRGTIYTTPGRPLRVWSDQKKKFIDLPMDSIASMEAVVLWEREDPEWRFKESGHDEKVFTGNTYPARETQYRITLTTGDTLTGGIVAPLYVRVDGQATQFVLNKRSKGEVGKKLGDLIYVRKLDLE